MAGYKHIFFDLDNTLWDFDISSMMVFERLFTVYHLDKYGIKDAIYFHDIYKGFNDNLWELYRQGKIEKDFLKYERFRLPLEHFGIIDDKLAHSMGNDYTFYSPRCVALVPHASEVLEYLKPNYHIHLITNGFVEVQNSKIQSSGLDKFIETMTVSEDIGIKKPDTRIFDYALSKAQASADESLMVGDDLNVDILPAKKINMDQIFFNRNKIQHKETITKEINDLTELYYFL